MDRFKIIIGVSFLFLILRIVFLDQSFLLPDERDLSLTGYSISKTGHDLFGNYMPLKFERISPNSPLIPMYYDVLWWKLPIVRNVFNSRLAFVLPASLLPLLIFELVFLLTKKKNISYLTALVFCFSPWIFNISRMGLEINLALPFLLTAVILQLRRKKILSCLFYFFAFFSYQGFRPLIIIVPFYFELYEQISKKFSLKKYLVSSTYYFLLFLFSIIISFFIENNLKSRSMNEIIFFSGKTLLGQFTHIFNSLLKGLGLSYLFKSGDYIPQYNNGVAGQFFASFFLFYFLGIVSLNKKTLGGYFLIGLAVLGMIPSVINIYSLTFSIRSSLAAVGLSALIAEGMIFGYEKLKKYNKYLKYSIILIFLAAIVFEAGTFFYNYFSIRPQLYANIFNEKDKELSVFLNGSTKKYLVRSPLPYSTFLSYLFMSDLTKEKLGTLPKMLKKNYDRYFFNKNRFEACYANEAVVPENLNETIIDETCLTALTKKDLDKKNYSKIYYFKKSAYYIFD